MNINMKWTNFTLRFHVNVPAIPNTYYNDSFCIALKSAFTPVYNYFLSTIAWLAVLVYVQSAIKKS